MQWIAMKIYIAIDIHLYRVQPPYRSSPPEQRKGWWYGGGWLEGTKGLFVYYSFYLLIFLSFCLPSWAEEWLVVWWWWLEGTTGLHRVTEGSQTFATSSHNAQSAHFTHCTISQCTLCTQCHNYTIFTLCREGHAKEDSDLRYSVCFCIPFSVALSPF